MKLKSYNILFRIFSYLSDKTNGAPLFVKYKLLLGTLILGLAGTTAHAQKKEVAKDTLSTTPATKEIITCYKLAIPSKSDNEKIVQGCVTDEGGEPIIGVTVQNKGYQTGVITDIDGKFSIKVKTTDILVFSFVGMETKAVLVSDIKTTSPIIMIDRNIDISCYIVVVSKNPSLLKSETTANVSIKEEDLPSVSNELTGIMCYGIVNNPYDNDEIYWRTTKERELDYWQVSERPLSPKGTLEDFEKWLQNNVRYNDKMHKDKVKGEVVVSFVVNKKGKIKEAKVTKSLSKDADKEAVRIISSSGAWKPGLLYGDPVKTKISLTIRFNNDIE